MDILMRDVVFADNIDCSRDEMRVVDFVRAVCSDDENRLRFRVGFNGYSHYNLQLVVSAPL